jgi:7-cyano-7-deazaguanine synthase in queuosine biosynthesis
MENTDNRVLLFSGGMDSFIAWHYLGKPKCVYFDIGLPICKEEIRVIEELGVPITIDTSVNLVDREEEGDSKFIPSRNLYYAMLACKYGDVIYMGGLKDDNVNDKNPDIFRDFSSLLTIMHNRTIQVKSPFWDMTKADIVKWYMKNVNDVTDALVETGSCYDLIEGRNYCGKCRCCFRKWVALWVNGIKLNYYNRNLMAEYLKAARAGKYVEQRNENIIKTIRDFLGKKTYYVDIDGVLTIETEGHDYFNRTPNKANIEKVNALFKLGHNIVLWTSRYPEDEEVTEVWLQMHNVKYHNLILGKPQYDFIIDDKAIALGI